MSDEKDIEFDNEEGEDTKDEGFEFDEDGEDTDTDDADAETGIEEFEDAEAKDDATEDFESTDETAPVAVTSPAAVVPSAPKKRGRPVGSKNRPKDGAGASVTPPRKPRAKKGAVKDNLTNTQRFVKQVLAKAGLSELPPLDSIMRGKTGAKVKISDIAVFGNEPLDPTLKEVYDAGLSYINTCNLSSPVDITRVKQVAVSILSKGRMFMPVQAAQEPTDEGDKEDTAIYQCTSGRHRLAFLALCYGPKAKIPVYCETLTESEARDAVVVANEARKTLALEKAEHMVLAATDGNTSMPVEQVYAKAVTSGKKVVLFVTYQLFERGYPNTLGFGVAMSAKRGENLTTLKNVEGYLKAALVWTKGMPFPAFDEKVRQALAFFDLTVQKMTKVEGFDATQHAAAMPLRALGKVYTELGYTDAMAKMDKIAGALVAMGAIARQKPDVTYAALSAAVR